MDNIFRLLRRNSKQILSLMLAFVVFVENPLTAFASPTTNESSNISKPVVDDDSPENFDPDTYTGEPFYFDENGNRIYDSENEELLKIREEIKEELESEQPDYSDIEWTFEDYPLTTMGDPEISTYIVGVDDAVYVVLAVAMAAYGVYMGTNEIKSFASNHFEPWVREKYGNDSTRMNTLQDWLAVKAGTTFATMKLFASMVGEFLGSGTLSEDSTSISFSRVPILSDTPYDWMRSYYTFLKAARIKISSSYCLDANIVVPSKSDASLNCFYHDGSSGGLYGIDFVYLYACYKANDRLYSTDNKVHMLYKMFNSTNNTYSSNVDNYEGIPLSVALKLGYPIFKDRNSFVSYAQYGTMGGLLTSSDDSSASLVDTIPIEKTWSGLRTGFAKNYTPSNTFNIPATNDALEKLLSSIKASDTEENVISNINTVWEISKKTSALTPEQSYSHLSYVLAAIAASADASITSEQIDSFISEYYGKYVDGTSARKEEQAEEIVRDFIVINGGGNNGDPDNDDKDNNKYEIAKKLAFVFGSFLLSIGAIQIEPDYASNPNIASNIKVNGYAPVEPNPDPDPSPNPGTGSDSSASSGLLKNIISAVEALPDKMVAGFSGLVSTVTDMARTIELLPNKLVLGFASTFSDLGTLVGSLPNAIADLMPGVLQSSLPDILANTFGLVNGFSFPAALSSIEAAIGALPAALTNPLAAIQSAIDTLADALTAPLAEIQKDLSNLPDKLADKLKEDKTPEEPPETDDGSGLFQNIFDILMLLILIIIALLILFLNCLILIFNLYQIPASTALFNENVLKGLEFLKSIKIPFPGTVGIGLFDLLLACVYFVLFTSLIATLRKKIEKFHV